MTPAETGRLGERLAAAFLEARGYQVMDATAVSLCRDNDLPIIVLTPIAVFVVDAIKT